MKLLNKIKLLILLGLLFSVLLANVDVVIETLDNNYDNTTTLGNWERNSKYSVEIKLYNNTGSAIDFNRVEANCHFDSTKFELLAKTDMINNWSATNFFIVENGQVQYQRAANTGEQNKTIPANSYITLYKLEFRINNDAAIGATSFTLDPNFTHVLYNISDITNSLQNLTTQVVGDITPPVTRILPASNLHLNQQIQISLSVDPNTDTNCYDLNNIHYTINGGNPTAGSPAYTGPITIPTNTQTTIRWIGVDRDGNNESVQTATYRVDTVDPVITNITTEPTLPNTLKNGDTITINFSAYDNIELTQTTVKIENNTATFVTQNGNNYQFVYTLPIQNEGTKTITITAIDHANNFQINIEKQFAVDNTVPTYSILSINPSAADIGDTVTFEFAASEQLDLNKSNITIGTTGTCSFLRKLGNNYLFKRTIDGTETSGWIMIDGYDLAGNNSSNLAGNSNVHISGYDLLNNYGEASASFNISY